MSAVTASLCFTLMFVGVFVFVSADQKNITAMSGQDVSLTCRAPNNNIIVVKWSRADLRYEYVLLYRDGHFAPDIQHLSFKNRVDLQDRQMKDGDVSLILKNVTINDAGTYECRVFTRKRRSWELFSIIHLHVVVRPDEKTITAESGQDVSLTCRSPNNNIRVLNWTRSDLMTGYVLLYHDGHSDPTHQHPSFKNRVYLQDRQMKDGDVSLILKDVTIVDSGTYECGVKMAETHSLDLDLISIINLIVIPDQKIIPAESGQDVTLTCRAPNNNIRVVKWSKVELDSDYVLLYRDGQFVPDDQDPCFKNRVGLQDKQMKDGDVSLILNNVTINDAGTYECLVLMKGTDSWKTISSIYLTVDPTGHTGGYTEDGSVGLKVGLLFSSVLLVAVVFFIYRKLHLRSHLRYQYESVKLI